MQHYNRAAIEQQLRLAVGDEVYDSIPNRRQNRPGSPRKPRQRRPRIVARLRLAMSGFLPPLVASGFTAGEVAALTIVAAEVRERGSCRLTISEIGRRANACRTLVKNAIHWAAHWGLLEVIEHRISKDRNAPNTIRITNATWLAWLRLRPGPVRPWGGGVISTTGNPVQQEERRERNETGPPSPRNARWRQRTYQP